MQGAKLLQKGYENFTGLIGHTAFTNGTSTNPLSDAEFASISAVYQVASTAISTAESTSEQIESLVEKEVDVVVAEVKAEIKAKAKAAMTPKQVKAAAKKASAATAPVAETPVVQTPAQTTSN
jgi:hypothetical protein